jgi:dihydrofolate reductase
MRELLVVNFVTLDGVMQGPGHPDEDREGGFEHGGWAIPYLDEVWGEEASAGMSEGDALLFGRKTYEKMEAHWPHQPDDDPIAATMNSFTKYVVSTTLEKVTWQNSVLVQGDVPHEIQAIKEGPGKNITVLGSGDLLRTLMRHDLVDGFSLLLCPLVLGSGKRLFREGAPKSAFELVRSKPTTTGALILSYRRAA